MDRRNFLHAATTTAATFAGLAASPLARAQAPGLSAALTERGSVLATRGPMTDRALPRNAAAAPGQRYRPAFRFGLGGTQIGNIFAALSDAQAQAVLQAAWDAGVRHFDTSPFYGYGLSEYRLGHFLRGKHPDDYVVSTKVGRMLQASRGPLPNAALWVQPAPMAYRYDFTAAGARRSVEDSLQRLGLPKIDIVYIHDLSPDNSELPGTWRDHFAVAAGTGGAMGELARMRDQGMIGGWGFGINTPDAAVLAAESDVPTPDVVLLACQYSILDHEVALSRTFPALQRKGISVVVGTPLNDGFLGGRNRYHFSDQIPAGAADKRARLAVVADRHGIDIRTAALQFAAAPAVVSAIIPGARAPGQVQANVASMRVTIPASFWESLRREGLISRQAPVPA
ncbi:aldo/keto reductase [Acidovorax sp. SUPP950]|uniref:aldo/keto reductase n=1 Tax=Acidovorax sp. SUPP950 TaxID=511901 RepID=UPI0023CCEC09|nr:aldo/keto reductase [Acidovorax sp. SUPP950]GKS77141.1 aldo/keto reductase [Acidovorax sp. SUPP950]